MIVGSSLARCEAFFSLYLLSSSSLNRSFTEVQHYGFIFSKIGNKICHLEQDKLKKEILQLKRRIYLSDGEKSRY